MHTSHNRRWFQHRDGWGPPPPPRNVYEYSYTYKHTCLYTYIYVYMCIAQYIYVYMCLAQYTSSIVRCTCTHRTRCASHNRRYTCVSHNTYATKQIAQYICDNSTIGDIHYKCISPIVLLSHMYCAITPIVLYTCVSHNTYATKQMYIAYCAIYMCIAQYICETTHQTHE